MTARFAGKVAPVTGGGSGIGGHRAGGRGGRRADAEPLAWTGRGSKWNEKHMPDVTVVSHSLSESDFAECGAPSWVLCCRCCALGTAVGSG